MTFHTLSTTTCARRVLTKVQVTFLSSATATVTLPAARSTLTGVIAVPPVWPSAVWVQVTLASVQPATWVSVTVVLPGATRECVSLDRVASLSSSRTVSLPALGAWIRKPKSCGLLGCASLITVIWPAATSDDFIWLVWPPTLPQLRLSRKKW